MPTIEEKIIAVDKLETEIREVIVNKDKIVERDNFITKTDTKNYVESKLQIVDRYEDKICPVYYREDKIVEVPYLLEKIVEKIVVMPQVVEVTKYVHEIL